MSPAPSSVMAGLVALADHRSRVGFGELVEFFSVLALACVAVGFLLVRLLRDP